MLRDLLADYAGPQSRFDELLASPGVPRAHWDAFLRALAARANLASGDTLALLERDLREHGSTSNVYSYPQAAHRPVANRSVTQAAVIVTGTPCRFARV